VEDRIVTARLTADNEVETVPLAMLADYQLITPPEDFSLLLTLLRRVDARTYEALQALMAWFQNEWTFVLSRAFHRPKDRGTLHPAVRGAGVALCACYTF